MPASVDCDGRARDAWTVVPADSDPAVAAAAIAAHYDALLKTFDPFGAACATLGGGEVFLLLGPNALAYFGGCGAELKICTSDAESPPGPHATVYYPYPFGLPNNNARLVCCPNSASDFPPCNCDGYEGIFFFGTSNYSGSLTSEVSGSLAPLGGCNPSPSPDQVFISAPYLSSPNLAAGIIALGVEWQSSGVLTACRRGNFFGLQVPFGFNACGFELQVCAYVDGALSSQLEFFYPYGNAVRCCPEPESLDCCFSRDGLLNLSSFYL
ncbi:MAG: hypothetical protein NZ534_12595 [Bacteroidia bacterium]|nr:hypothetical protein [Bacteroidia bacterium]